MSTERNIEERGAVEQNGRPPRVRLYKPVPEAEPTEAELLAKLEHAESLFTGAFKNLRTVQEQLKRHLREKQLQRTG